MSLSEEIKLEIGKYKLKSFIYKDKKQNYDLREIIKYVVYCQEIIKNNKSKIGISGGSFLTEQETKTEIGYGQLEHVSFGISLDPKVPLDSFILSVFEFFESNKFLENDMNLVKKFIDDYYIFMEPIEYKSPIYLSIAYLCISNIKKEVKTKPTQFVADELIQGDIIGGYSGEEDEGSESEGEYDYGEFGDDDDDEW